MSRNEVVIRIRILLADNDPIARNLLGVALQNPGKLYMGDGQRQRGMESDSKVGRATMVILDWMMPGMGGVDIGRKIRESEGRNSLYVLLLNIRDAKNDMIKALDAEADDYLTKPFRSRCAKGSYQSRRAGDPTATRARRSCGENGRRSLRSASWRASFPDAHIVRISGAMETPGSNSKNTS